MNAQWAIVGLVVVGCLVSVLLQRRQTRRLRKEFDHEFDELSRAIDHGFAELHRRFDEFFKHLDKRFDHLEARLDGLRLGDGSEQRGPVWIRARQFGRHQKN